MELSNYKRYDISGEALCKKHGIHKSWTKRSDGKVGVRCCLCLSELAKKLRHKDPIKEKLKQARCRSKKIGRVFDITSGTVLVVFSNQLGRCALTGIVIDKLTDLSIDRIDSSKGYTKDNIQIVHKDLNCMKWDLSQQQFIDYCKQVVEWNRKI